mmetsp:Transcript_26730/g.54539  ORF Transcript_26730/g.54539 Transcript_26730/m.54539 type:complete len:378 (-) Transcript_26730:233-1366(-)
MCDSLDALEALLKFRKSVTRNGYFYPRPDPRLHPEVPVPDPLNPSLPHYIENDGLTSCCSSDFDFYGSSSAAVDIQFGRPSEASNYAIDADVISASVPNPLKMPEPGTAALPPSNTLSSLSIYYGSFYNKNAPRAFSSANASPVCTKTNSSQHDAAVKAEAVSTADVSVARSLQNHLSDPVVRSEKVRDALNSKPQRGKKRGNLNELERLELTRTRNREHAKSTRMKKKQRFHELLAIEKKWQVMNELNVHRRKHLANFIERSESFEAKRSTTEVACLADLQSLAREKLLNAEFSISGPTNEAIALSGGNSGTAQVIACGQDVVSGKIKTSLCVVCVKFASKSTEIVSASLFWSAWNTSNASPSAMFPSVSASSFES